MHLNKPKDNITVKTVGRLRRKLENKRDLLSLVLSSCQTVITDINYKCIIIINNNNNSDYIKIQDS